MAKNCSKMLKILQKSTKTFKNRVNLRKSVSKNAKKRLILSCLLVFVRKNKANQSQ